MSLDWDVTGCKDLDEELKEKWLDGLIWACLVYDMTGVTEENLVEWEFRLRYADNIGHFLLRDPEGKGHNVDPEVLPHFVGMRTNVAEKSRFYFFQKLNKTLTEDVTRKMTRKKDEISSDEMQQLLTLEEAKDVLDYFEREYDKYAWVLNGSGQNSLDAGEKSYHHMLGDISRAQEHLRNSIMGVEDSIRDLEERVVGV